MGIYLIEGCRRCRHGCCLPSLPRRLAGECTHQSGQRFRRRYCLLRGAVGGFKRAVAA